MALVCLIYHHVLPVDNTSGSVTGKVIDQDSGEPIEFVSVAIYNARDNSLVTGTISNEKGDYILQGLSAGRYNIEVSFIGYEKQILSDIEISTQRSQIDLKSVYLPRSISQLDEIEIVAEEMAVEYKIDRKVINVSQQLTSASGTATDILENVPSITVDVDGNVSLRGSTGFMLLIDGRPTVLEPSEALQQIPANAIENIEIITNPSAKYNPDGTSGIINIVTKKNKLKGLPGTANLNAGTYKRYGGGFLANYTSKKWNAFIGADINKGTRPGNSSSERVTSRDDTTYFTKADGTNDRARNFWVLRGGLGFNPTDKDIINVKFNYGLWQHESSTILDYNEWIEPGSVIIDEYESQEFGERGGNFYSFETDYTHNFTKEGHNLSTHISYRNREGKDTNQNRLIDSFGDITSGQINTEDGPGGRLQMNLDYILPFGEKNKLEAGYQSRIGRSTDATTLSFYNPVIGDFELHPEYSNNTQYHRDIHSLYGIYAGEKGNFGYQIGLRGEYTSRVITSTGYEGEFVIDRLDYFPTLHTSYKLPDDQQIMASYSRRIQRSRSWYLEPFITWEDAYNVRKGNPDLKPEYIDAMEIAYMNNIGNHTLSFEGYYRITHNKVERIRSVL